MVLVAQAICLDLGPFQSFDRVGARPHHRDMKHPHDHF